MTQVTPGSLKILSGTVLAFCCFIFVINYCYYKYPGNNYYPQGLSALIFILVFFNLGLILYFEKGHKFRQMGKELIYFFGIMGLVALMTNAVQLTPFSTIDPSIVALEERAHIHMSMILIWTSHHPQFKYLLEIIYASLTYQMSFLPLLIIITCRFDVIREYYFHLLCTTLIGFTFYYFFPTTAPASVINSPLFSADQLATGLKFKQIHHYIIPTTLDGGLIALPSFHTVWAILCVNLVKKWTIPYLLLLVNNFFLIASCVLLGWHYCTDIVGGFIVLLISYWVLDKT